MSDAIVINSLERALSEDINDLQAMSTRQLADQIKFLFAKRFTLLSGGSDDTLPRSVTGGLSIRSSGGGTSIDLMPGFLGQFNATWPAVPGRLESDLRLGFNRAALTTALPGTPDQVVLLEARVVDVVTINVVRDVFDVPTQTFVPTALDKRTERQIEVQFVESAIPQLPAFSGGTWVPLWVFDTDGAGQTDLASVGANYDFRPDMQDILGGGDQQRGTYAPTATEGVVAQASMQSGRPDGSGDVAFAALGGDFAGRIGDMQFRFRNQLSNQIPSFASGFTLSLNTIAHLYMLPLNSSGIETAPWNFSASSPVALQKGALHLSSVQPSNGGRVHSATITPSPAVYANFDPVPAGRAIYVGSVYGGGATGIRFISQSAGGRAILGSNVGANPLFGIVNSSVAVGVGLFSEPLDMRGLIPNAARLVTVVINVRWGSLVQSTLAVGLQPLAVALGGSVARFTVEVSTTEQFNRATMQVELPVYHRGDVDNEDKQWEITLLSSQAGNYVVTVDDVGWSL